MRLTIIQLGHRKIGFINGPSFLPGPRVMLKGYRDKLAQHEIPFNPEYVRVSYFNESKVREDALGLVNKEVTAIVTIDDLRAAVCMQAATSKGLRVPEDLSVIGFRDAPFSRYLHPSLTTLRFPFDRIAWEAISMVHSAEGEG